MALDTGKVQDLLAYYAVVAALIVTVSYSGVLTPPKEYSNCSDLCLDTVERVVLGVRAAFGICLPEGEGSGSAQACHVLADDEDFPGPKNHLQWLDHQTFVKNYVTGLPATAQSPTFSGLYQAYLFFNGTALCSALFCIAVGVLFTYTALAAADSRNENTVVMNLGRVRVLMEASLLLSLTCQFLAFMFALFWVLFIDEGNNAGIIAVWIIGCVLFLSIPVMYFGFWLWDHKYKSPQLPVHVQHGQPAAHVQHGQPAANGQPGQPPANVQHGEPPAHGQPGQPPEHVQPGQLPAHLQDQPVY